MNRLALILPLFAIAMSAFAQDPATGRTVECLVPADPNEGAAP